MRPDELIRAFETRRRLAISASDLAALLEAAKIAREEDTGRCKQIRILRLQESILVQEFSDSGEILVRTFRSLGDAGSFVDKRMEAYVRMWDGSGGRIDYHKN